MDELKIPDDLKLRYEQVCLHVHARTWWTDSEKMYIERIARLESALVALAIEHTRSGVDLNEAKQELEVTTMALALACDEGGYSDNRRVLIDGYRNEAMQKLYSKD